MPRQMDTEFNARELAAIDRYVKEKERAQQELTQLQAQALQARGS